MRGFVSPRRTRCSSTAPLWCTDAPRAGMQRADLPLPRATCTPALTKPSPSPQGPPRRCSQSSPGKHRERAKRRRGGSSLEGKGGKGFNRWVCQRFPKRRSVGNRGEVVTQQQERRRSVGHGCAGGCPAQRPRDAQRERRAGCGCWGVRELCGSRAEGESRCRAASQPGFPLLRKEMCFSEGRFLFFFFFEFWKSNPFGSVLQKEAEPPGCDHAANKAWSKAQPSTSMVHPEAALPRRSITRGTFPIRCNLKFLIDPSRGERSLSGAI